MSTPRVVAIVAIFLFIAVQSAQAHQASEPHITLCPTSADCTPGGQR